MKSIAVILLSFSILLNICFLVKLDRTKTSLEISIFKELNIADQLDNKIESEKTQFELNNKTFHGRQSTLDSLKTIINDNPKLLFCFTESSCETCVDQCIEDLKNLGNKIGNENILIFTTYKNKRQSVFLQKRLEDKFNVFNVTSESFITPSNNYFFKSPNFSIIDKNLTINFVYIYSINFPEIQNSYIDFVESYFKSHI